MNIRRPSLDKHIRHKKVLKTPFSAIPNLNWTSVWYPHQIANYLWLILLFSEDNRERLLGSLGPFVKKLQEIGEILTDPKGLPLSHLHLEDMSDNEANSLLELVLDNSTNRALINILQHIPDLPGKRHFKRFFDLEELSSESLKVLEKAVFNAISQETVAATDIAWLMQGVMICSGKMILTQNVANSVLESLNNYPLEGGYEKYGGQLRASRNGFLGIMAKERQSEVVEQSEKFWSWCYNHTDCSWMGFGMPEADQEKFSDDANLIITEVGRIVQHAVSLNDGHNLNDSDREKSAVVTSRYLQCCDILLATINSGPVSTTLSYLGLRTVFEILATDIYLSNNDQYSEFITYGRGKLKLMSHKDSACDFFEANFPFDMEALANDEVAEMAVDVDLGSFFKGGIRKISEEVGLKDLYDRIYDVSSSFAHGEWSALRAKYLLPCVNPLHRYHLLPSIGFSSNLTVISLMLLMIDNYARNNLSFGLTPLCSDNLPDWVDLEP